MKPVPDSDPKPSAGPAPGGPAPAVHSAWAWPVAWVATVFMVVGGLVLVFRSCRDAPVQLVEKIGKGMAEVAAAFNRGTVTTSFTSYATTISGSQFFQFATLNQEERFQRTDEATTAFGYIPLPDIIIEATAPVTYTYYLDLNEHWEFTLQDGGVMVTAPDIHYNKPAVDASRITYEVKKNSMIRDTHAAMDGLKKSITWMANQKAAANRDLVRETGRKQTELFVQNWLAQSFADGKKYPVTVRFRNEARTNGPALRLKKD